MTAACRIGIAWAALSVLLLGAAPGSSAAKPPRSAAAVSARAVPATAQVGDTVKLELSVALDSGYHTYDIDQPDMKSVATRITLDPADGLEASGRWSGTRPQAKYEPALGKRVFIHDASPTWTQEFQVLPGAAAGKHTIEGKIHYQVCDDNGCLPPRDDSFTATVEVKGVAAGRPSGARSASTKNAAAAEAPAALRPKPNYPARFTVSAEPAEAAPRGEIELRIRADLDAGWHIYATSMKQAKSGPRPTVIRLTDRAGLEPRGGVTANTRPITAADPSFGTTSEFYERRVTWSLPIAVPASARPGTYVLKGVIDHQVCNESSCLAPTSQAFEVTVRVLAPGRRSADAAEPAPAVASSDVEPTDPAAGAGSRGGAADHAQLSGSILADAAGDASAHATDPYALNTADSATLAAALENGVVVNRTRVGGVAAALGFGFIAGFILNFMPCVLPVISLKIYGFVKQAGEDRSRVRLLGLAFGAGIVTVFLVLAAFAAFAGLGWGQQFQSNVFWVSMIALMLIFALGMFDLYTIQLPGFTSSLEAAAAEREGLPGAFGKGMLATLLATPCSGPFLGATLSYALIQPPGVIFAIFSSIGLGMAFPYVLMAWSPGWLKLLPRPGEWMNWFKEVMGFLMLGTAAWLLWQRRANGELVVWTVVFCIFVALAAWLYGRLSDPLMSAAKRLAAPAVGVAVIALSAYVCFGLMYAPATHWEPYSQDRLLALEAEGKTVMVDFTADW